MRPERFRYSILKEAFGASVLWVLNGCEMRVAGRKDDWLLRFAATRPWRKGFAQPAERLAMDAGARMALVLKCEAKSG